MLDVAAEITRLTAGAASWAGRSASERAALARQTALTMAAAADAWVEAAVAIKRAGGPAGDSPVWAEETAIGPLPTLRLLLITARSLADISRTGLPAIPRPPRLVHAGGEAARVAVDVLPAAGPGGSLHDGTIFGGHRATVRCVDPGGLEAFERSWRDEAARRPRAGGVALVLGAGNVTGLAPADCISQIFEHGRAVLLKLHPLHAPLEPVLRAALGPLVEAGLLAIGVGGKDLAAAALAEPAVGHVHLTGGSAAFDALVWDGRDRRGLPALDRSISCELGNVTPWIVLPGRYPAAALARQADFVAASILNNTSFNCIATKLVVTAAGWDQREDFLARVRRRLEAARPRPAWYPGAAAAWEQLAGRPAPADGTLPCVFRTGINPAAEPELVDREWFLPVAAEIPLAADSLEAFCGGVHDLVARLPGSLAASVTRPDDLSGPEAARAELLIEHLPFGVVAVNTWSALAYSLGNVPWGGLPGATLAQPRSGIGFVHDPLFLPLVHNTILRGPVSSRLVPAWFPWHRQGLRLARGLLDSYAGIARGGRGLWPIVRMVPAVLAGGA
jgi:acyl-CoA reductase-like NAD-dependent aldehyde dehydrogenase